MRLPLALLLLLLAPSAHAASQVHATYLGDAYAVTFVSEREPVIVSHSAGAEVAQRVEAQDGDADVAYRVRLPARALRYEIEGRTFELPTPPRANDTTRVVFVADIGTDANATRVLEAIARAKPSLLVVGGDLSYANGNASVWNEWFELMEPLASRMPMMPAYGNHEDYCEGEDFALEHCGPGPNGWNAHFALPNGEKLYYAFEWGPLSFTMLDTEAYEASEPTTDADVQEQFLNASLAKDDARWNVVVYHRPLRSTNAREGLASEQAREALLPLLQGRADLVLQAHLHAYERAKAENGTTFVTSGGGGRPLYGNWSAMEPWVEKRAAEFHFLVIDASPQQIRVRAVRVDDTTLDAFEMARPAPVRPTLPPQTPTATPSRATTPFANASNVSENVSESNETPTPPFALVAASVIALAMIRRKGASER